MEKGEEKVVDARGVRKSERDQSRGTELRAYAPNLGCILDAPHVATSIDAIDTRPGML